MLQSAAPKTDTQPRSQSGSHSQLSAMDLMQWLVKSSSNPAEFWPNLARALQKVSGAQQVLLYASARAPKTPWQIIAAAPQEGPEPALDALAPRHLRARAMQDGIALSAAGEGEDLILCAAKLESDQQDLLIALRGAQRKGAGSGHDLIKTLTQLATLASAPLCFESHRGLSRANRDAARLAQVLELVAKLSDADSFQRAALAWVNGLAEQFACESVSLVWRARDGMRLAAISHAERVERRSQASALAEQAAAEALAQGVEVSWPAENTGPVAHSHGQYGALVHPGHMITLPMSELAEGGAQTALGAVLLERRRAPFTAAEKWALRLHCELAQPTLNRMQRDTHWLPRRVARAIAPSIPRALKPRKLSGRALVAAGLAALIALAFVPVPFRLSATAVLKTDQIAYVGAPYDGFVEASEIILGDVVEMGAPLLSLDRSQLLLERDALLAQLASANREAEIHRAAGALSEMLIAQSHSEQVQAQLMQIDLRLASAEVRAPIAGIVVEGEPAKMIGEAVRRGDGIVTVAALDGLHIEAMVSERDLAFLAPGQTATLSLLARPRDRLQSSVSLIIPAAQVQDAENVFPIRLQTPPGAIPKWWLPGMTGVVKIHAGQKPLGWLAARRLTDYLRLALWI